MAGEGNRFKLAGYKQPKPLIDINGKTMIQRVIENIKHNELKFIFCVNKQQVIDWQLDKLLKSYIDCEIVIIDKLTEGPVCSCLWAINYINNFEELIILNCDQIIKDWNFDKFNLFCRANFDISNGIIGIFSSNNVKNSYAKIDNDFIIELREKQVISNYATNGLHYWKHGYLFINSAIQMILNNDRVNNEFYVAPTFNYLIKTGSKILPYFFNEHFPIGTPEDIERYKKLENF